MFLLPDTGISNKRRLLKSIVKIGVLSATLLGVASCATSSVDERAESKVVSAPLSQSAQINTVSQPAQSSTDVAQISVASADYTAKQISADVDTTQLTVDQLKAYADRCAPGEPKASDDIDCSELSLRVRRVFKSEDRVAEALITLNRLGRTDSSEDIDDELGRNRGDLSYSAQAVASGALDTPPPTLPEEPIITDELESFLNEIGLGVNAGAIVQPGG